MGEGIRYARHFNGLFLVVCVGLLLAFSMPPVRDSVSLYIDSPYGRLIDGGLCLRANAPHLWIRGQHLVTKDGAVFASFEKVANDKIKLERTNGRQWILQLERVGGLWDFGVIIMFDDKEWIYC